MPDARLSDRWLGDVAMEELSDAAWRVFTSGLMFCVRNGTNGEVKRRFLRYLHPEGVMADANAELVRAGLWKTCDDGFQFAGWSLPARQGGLGQSTAEEVESYYEKKRTRQQAYRDRKKQEASLRSEVETGNVTDDVTRHVGGGGGVGVGGGRDEEEDRSDPNAQQWVQLDDGGFAESDTGVVRDARITDWPTVKIPDSGRRVS